VNVVNYIIVAVVAYAYAYAIIGLYKHHRDNWIIVGIVSQLRWLIAYYTTIALNAIIKVYNPVIIGIAINYFDSNRKIIAISIIITLLLCQDWISMGKRFLEVSVYNKLRSALKISGIIKDWERNVADKILDQHDSILDELIVSVMFDLSAILTLIVSITTILMELSKISSYHLIAGVTMFIVGVTMNILRHSRLVKFQRDLIELKGTRLDTLRSKNLKTFLEYIERLNDAYLYKLKLMIGSGFIITPVIVINLVTLTYLEVIPDAALLITTIGLVSQLEESLHEISFLQSSITKMKEVIKKLR
jgi:hypothetical protein